MAELYRRIDSGWIDFIVALYERSSRRVCISLVAWELLVRLAAARPSLRRATASSVRPSLARVWADIW